MLKVDALEELHHGVVVGTTPLGICVRSHFAQRLLDDVGRRVRSEYKV